MNVNRLNARRVETLKKPGRHADGAGLYLVIRAGGSKAWAFLWRQDGRLREMGLGSVNAVPLIQARELAANCRATVAAGGDPIADRKRTKPVPTFKAMSEELIASLAPGWRNGHSAEQWRQTLADYAAPLMDRQVDVIGTEDVLQALKPLWSLKPETASRLRGRIERILDAAKALGHRQGENPARWRGHLASLLPSPGKRRRGNHAAMPYADVPALMQRLRHEAGVAALALQWIILTASRAGEALGARWSEIDLVGKVWTVPASRMKAGHEHRVPLSDAALTILSQLRPDDGRQTTDDGYVFPGLKRGKALTSQALVHLRARLGLDVTTHGFRSSFRDWAGDTGFAREIAEAALAHTVGDATERAYRRGDALAKRRALMDAWAQFLVSRDENNVVPLRR